MKFKLFMFVVFIISASNTFAAAPPNPNPNAAPGPPGLPINSYLVLFFLSAIVFAYCKLKQKKTI